MAMDIKKPVRNCKVNDPKCPIEIIPCSRDDLSKQRKKGGSAYANGGAGPECRGLNPQVEFPLSEETSSLDEELSKNGVICPNNNKFSRGANFTLAFSGRIARAFLMRTLTVELA